MAAPSGVVALRVVGLVGLLALVAGGAGSLVAGFFEQRSTQTSVVDGVVTALDVRAGSGDVTVEVGPAGGPTTVTAARSWAFDPPVETRTFDAGTLRLSAACGPGAVFAQRCSVDWTVSVPSDAAVTVSTSSGDIRVEDVAGRVALRTGAGDVRLSAVRSKDVRVETGAGDARLVFASAPDSVVTTTGAGDVTVRLPADGTTYRVVGSSGVGDRTVSVPEDAASRHLLDLTSGVGDVVVASGGAQAAG
jgi:hypothetical protein